MPVYEFVCQECGSSMDLKVPYAEMIADDFKAECQLCGAPMRRVYTTFALRIKKGPTERLGEDMKI